MSWFESVVAAIENVGSKTSNINLSTYIKTSLATLAKYDKLSRDIILRIKEEEKQLYDSLETLCKERTSAELLELDETPYIEGLKNLNNKRQQAASLYDYQIKIAYNCYELLEKKIYALDAAMLPLVEQLPNIIPNSESEIHVVKKKRTSTVSDDFDEILNALSQDPNEPKYCLCKRVSYGEMVACENPDCQVEWFHFKCVGLKKAPADPWFCPYCSSNNGLSSEAINVDLDEQVQDEQLKDSQYAE